MEETMDTQYLLERILDSSRKQEKYGKWRCIFSAATAACGVVVLVILLGILPRINGIANQAEVVLEDVAQMSSQLAKADWAGLTADLEGVSKEIAQANLGGLAQEVGGLVQSSQTGLEEALGKLNAIDLDTLNQAIADLSAVIKPLANFVEKFS